MRYVLLSIVVLCLACVAQDSPKLTETPEQQLNRLLGREVKPDSAPLNECLSTLRQWENWSKVNLPICQKWNADNDELIARNQVLADDLANQNREIGTRIFTGCVGLGFGMFLAFRAIKAIRRWWPSSKQRRQLITLLLMATWVTIAAVVALSDSRLSYHPVNLAFSVLVYSLPALAFGGVGVWWFGRTKPEILW
jgi:hypothetical protein